VHDLVFYCAEENALSEEKKVVKEGVDRRHHPRPASLLVQTRRLLRYFGLRARKGLGQHFLIDEEVLQCIISAAELTSSDVVMEIGPGLGVLTKELAKKAGWVIAVELDGRLAALLKQTMASFSNVAVINADILQTDPAALLGEQKERFPSTITAPFNYKVVANLPYYITAHVLRHFLEARVKPQSMVIMVQKEVAQAIVAEPGQMSVLSISVQFYGKPRIISHVLAQCFYPAPEVDSAILRIDLYPQPALGVSDNDGFFGVVRAGFSGARKQMGNSLALGLGVPKAEALSLLERAGIAPQRRAETLALEEWARLWREFARAKEAAC